MNESAVSLSHTPLSELFLQTGKPHGSPRSDHKAGGPAVEAVHDASPLRQPGRRERWPILGSKPARDGRSAVTDAVRVHGDAAWLLKNDQVLVFMNNHHRGTVDAHPLSGGRRHGQTDLELLPEEDRLSRPPHDGAIDRHQPALDQFGQIGSAEPIEQVGEGLVEADAVPSFVNAGVERGILVWRQGGIGNRGEQTV